MERKEVDAFQGKLLDIIEELVKGEESLGKREATLREEETKREAIERQLDLAKERNEETKTKAFLSLDDEGRQLRQQLALELREREGLQVLADKADFEVEHLKGEIEAMRAEKVSLEKRLKEANLKISLQGNPIEQLDLLAGGHQRLVSKTQNWLSLDEELRGSMYLILKENKAMVEQNAKCDNLLSLKKSQLQDLQERLSTLEKNQEEVYPNPESDETTDLEMEKLRIELIRQKEEMDALKASLQAEYERNDAVLESLSKAFTLINAKKWDNEEEQKDRGEDFEECQAKDERQPQEERDIDDRDHGVAIKSSLVVESKVERLSV